MWKHNQIWFLSPLSFSLLEAPLDLRRFPHCYSHSAQKHTQDSDLRSHFQLAKSSTRRRTGSKFTGIFCLSFFWLLRNIPPLHTHTNTRARARTHLLCCMRNLKVVCEEQRNEKSPFAHALVAKQWSKRMSVVVWLDVTHWKSQCVRKRSAFKPLHTRTTHSAIYWTCTINTYTPPLVDVQKVSQQRKKKNSEQCSNACNETMKQCSSLLIENCSECTLKRTHRRHNNSPRQRTDRQITHLLSGGGRIAILKNCMVSRQNLVFFSLCSFIAISLSSSEVHVSEQKMRITHRSRNSKSK